jgi:hypothetical protein
MSTFTVQILSFYFFIFFLLRSSYFCYCKMGQTFMRQKVTLFPVSPSNQKKEGSKANETKVESVQFGSELRECGTLFSECNVAITCDS